MKVMFLQRVLCSVALSLLLLAALQCGGSAPQPSGDEDPSARADSGAGRTTTHVEADRERKLPGTSRKVMDMTLDRRKCAYVVDASSKNIKVYDSTGNRVRTIGGPGTEPGTFSLPLSVAVSKSQDVLAVGDFTGRISFFSLDGAFLHSFVVPGLMPQNSSIRFLKDTLLAVGGFRPPKTRPGKWDQLAQEDMGDVIHVYTQTGTERYSFFPFSDLGRKMKTLRILGTRFDQGASGRLYALQATDYSIGVFTPSGDSLGTLEVSPAYYRPLHEPQPVPGTVSATDFDTWYRSWDSPKRIFSVNDTLLAASVHRGEDLADQNFFRYRVDFIGKSDGHVYRSIEVDEKPLAVDSGEQLLYFLAPPAQGTAPTLHAYRLRTLLQEGNLQEGKAKHKSAQAVAAR